MPKSIVELDSESRPELKTVSYPHLGTMGVIACVTLTIILFVFPDPSLLVLAFLTGSAGLLFCYHIAENKRELSESLDPPHKIYPQILRWERGDQICVNDPYDSGDHIYFPNVVDGYFQGVLDDYSILISNKEELENSENTFRVSAHTLKIVDSASFAMGVQNKTLEKRKKEKKKDNAKELLENSDYDKMLNEVKSEFNDGKLTV